MPCYAPLDVRRPDWAVVHRYISVPCGRCVGCRLERARNWTVRIMHEAQMHKENSFLTLTYDDEHLSYGNTQSTLYKPDLQKFFKRLRKELRGTRIRYFAVGEYGSQRRRAHYHACLFGYDFPDKTLQSTAGGNNLYHSRLLDTVWGNGHCSVGALTAGTAAYVARYVLDKQLGKEAEAYEELGIEPEFSVMSRRPGIGADWFKKYASDVYPHDTVVLDDGRKQRPPRYYDEVRKNGVKDKDGNYVQTPHPEEIQSIKIARMNFAESRISEQSAVRMLGKRKFHELRVKSFKKILHD